MTSKVVPINAWKKNIQRGDNGKPVKGLTNVVTFVRGVAGHDLRYNELADRIEYRGDALKKSDFSVIQLMMEPHGIIPTERDLTNAIELVAVENEYHPIREYLEGLPVWDKRNRLEIMFPRLFGSPDTKYEQMIGKRYMIGAVARVMNPGCKMDNMLVLEGPQSIGKSTALQILFTPEYFTEMVGSLRDHRRFVEQILGKWCVEFAEFETLNESSIEMIKAVVTIQIDRTTRNFSRVGATEHPRQSVLAATINPKKGCGYLKDPTGNRRFWPVRCKKVDFAKLTNYRQQLWAEALHRYKDGEQWHLEDEEYNLAAIEQTKRETVDIWEDMLEEYLDKEAKYASHEILYDRMKMDAAKQGQSEKNRLAGAMSKLGWINQPSKRGGKSVRLWRYAPDYSEEDEE